LNGTYDCNVNQVGTVPSYGYLEIGNASVFGCDGNGGIVDDCDVCGGDNFDQCRSGCDNQPFSNKTFDVCGICGGNATNIDQCCAYFDQCGVCNGTGFSCVCQYTDGYRGISDNQLNVILAEYEERLIFSGVFLPTAVILQEFYDKAFSGNGLGVSDAVLLEAQTEAVAFNNQAGAILGCMQSFYANLLGQTTTFVCNYPQGLKK